MKTEKKINSICFFMAGTLFDFNLRVAKTLRQENPDVKLSAFVCGRRHLLDEIKSLDKTPDQFNRYDWLNQMIDQWIATPYDSAKLEHYRTLFGDDLLRRLIVADRELGNGYVCGGIVENTKLIQLCETHSGAQWNYVVGLLNYCFDLLSEQKPDIVFTYVIAGADAMALKIVSDYLKIPCVQLSFTRVNDYYMFDKSIEMTMPQIKQTYLDAIKDRSTVEEDYDEASKFIDSFINKPEPPQDTLTWVRRIRKENHPIMFVKTLAIDIIKAAAIYMGLQGSKGIYRQRRGLDIVRLTVRKFFAIHKLTFSKMDKPDSVIGKSPYVSYFLHYDPEMTTLVMADKNTDQIAVIEQISKQMPVGWKLIVKEHIPMIGRRPNGFYERIKKIPDVVLVSPFESSFHILKNANVVCTLTGTVGWEAMLFGKTPVVMGYPYYINVVDGVVHCPKASELAQAIKMASEAKPASIEHLKLFVASMLKHSFAFSTRYYWYGEKLDDKKLNEQVEVFVRYLKREV